MKYEFKGTPAPWEYIGNPGKHFDPVIYSVKTRGQLNKEGRNYKDDEAEVDNICIAGFKTWQDDIPQEEHQANGCLIAAAPDLLEALKDHEAPLSCTLADALRELGKLIENKLPNELHWSRWCEIQSNKIEKAVNKALNIQP